MTIERATELVAEMDKVNHAAAVDLSRHFIDYFGIEGEDNLISFLELSGYQLEEA